MSNRDLRSGLILLIEDNRDVAQAVGDSLERYGYSIDYATDGISGLHLAVTHSYDVVVIDLILPGMDGLDICRKLRGDAKKSTPILMLTGRDTLEDKLSGLEAGADDYLVKPFEQRELEARLRALIRRNRQQVSTLVLKVGDLVLDTATFRVTRAGQELDVSPIGLKVLAILMRESPRVVSRSAIEREIWGDTLPDSDTLRSHLYNLRRVIDKPFAHPLLHTIHSAGYRIGDVAPQWDQAIPHSIHQAGAGRNGGPAHPTPPPPPPSEDPEIPAPDPTPQPARPPLTDPEPAPLQPPVGDPTPTPEKGPMAIQGDQGQRVTRLAR